MHTKHLTLMITLAAATTLGAISLNAAEAACPARAKADQIQTGSATPAKPSLPARNIVIVASPKVRATFPQLGQAPKGHADQPVMACTCCQR